MKNVPFARKNKIVVFNLKTMDRNVSAYAAAAGNWTYLVDSLRGLPKWPTAEEVATLAQECRGQPGNNKGTRVGMALLLLAQMQFRLSRYIPLETVCFGFLALNSQGTEQELTKAIRRIRPFLQGRTLQHFIAIMVLVGKIKNTEASHWVAVIIDMEQNTYEIFDGNGQCDRREGYFLSLPFLTRRIKSELKAVFPDKHFESVCGLELNSSFQIGGSCGIWAITYIWMRLQLPLPDVVVMMYVPHELHSTKLAKRIEEANASERELRMEIKGGGLAEEALLPKLEELQKNVAALRQISAVVQKLEPYFRAIHEVDNGTLFGTLLGGISDLTKRSFWKQSAKNPEDAFLAFAFRQLGMGPISQAGEKFFTLEALVADDADEADKFFTAKGEARVQAYVDTAKKTGLPYDEKLLREVLIEDIIDHVKRLQDILEGEADYSDTSAEEEEEKE